MLEITGGGKSHVGLVAKQGKQKCGRDGYLAFSLAVIVLHGVFSTDAGQTVGSANPFQFSIGPYQLRQLKSAVRCFCRLDGVGPTEVVQTRHLVHVQAHTDSVADRFINGRGSHSTRIKVRIARRNTARNDQPVWVAVNWSDESGVSGTVSCHTNKRLDRCLGDDFVVVLTHPCLLAGDVGAGKHSQQKFAVIGL